jgi:hypothetical protein
VGIAAEAYLVQTLPTWYRLVPKEIYRMAHENAGEYCEEHPKCQEYQHHFDAALKPFDFEDAQILKQDG